ncbi:MAG: hypothetical protein RIG62_08330 [Cyclobacteriaceae bacterium]
MSESLSYRNSIDKQLSMLAEDDKEFKAELIGIYTEYMDEIQYEFALLLRKKDQEGLALLHHKHKTTCHVLALQALNDAFERARSLLTTPPSDSGTQEVLISQVNTICRDALAQLQDI